VLALLDVDEDAFINDWLFLLCPDDDCWSAPPAETVGEQVRLAARIQASRGPGRFVLCLAP
jgi:hypothetical protein